MITQEQYDQLNDGDTVTARYDYAYEQFEVTGNIYMCNDKKRLAGWNLRPDLSGYRFTIIEHIPAIPASVTS